MVMPKAYDDLVANKLVEITHKYSGEFPTLKVDAEVKSTLPKKKRGRPVGSKNKPKVKDGKP